MQNNANPVELLAEEQRNNYTVFADDEDTVFCTTLEDGGGVINRMDFYYQDQLQHTEWKAEWFMGGNTDTSIGSVKYLTENCDAPKSFTVVGSVWTGECFRETFTLQPACA